MRVAGRVDYEWATSWMTDPRKYDPRTKVLVPTALSPDDVRMFVSMIATDRLLPVLTG